MVGHLPVIRYPPTEFLWVLSTGSRDQGEQGESGIRVGAEILASREGKPGRRTKRERQWCVKPCKERIKPVLGSRCFQHRSQERLKATALRINVV